MPRKKKLKFEDCIESIDTEISKRRSRWNLTALSWMDFSDVSQILRIHIYKKWDMYDPSKPLKPWINRIISNQIKNKSTSINTNNFRYREQSQSIQKTVPSRAIRAAITEIAEYLDCVLYLKDECLDEYQAKEERRKRSNDSLDMF